MSQKISLDDLVEDIKKVGDMLVPYNWPQNDPRLETELHKLKSRIIDIDGYTIKIHFNRGDYESHYVETLQIMGEKCPFLPFCLVARIGKKFLGDHNLYLVELMKDNRKIYCWSITLDKQGRPIDPQIRGKTEECQYDGFKYQYIYPSQVNFF